MFDNHKSFGADGARSTFEIVFLKVLFYKPGQEKVLNQRDKSEHNLSPFLERKMQFIKTDLVARHNAYCLVLSEW